MKRIVIFVMLTALFSTPFWWLHAATGYGPYIALLMSCPGLAGAATLLGTGGKLSALAWRGTQLKWIAIGWLVPLVGLVRRMRPCACWAGRRSRIRNSSHGLAVLWDFITVQHS
jgi:hypothetical protein